MAAIIVVNEVIGLAKPALPLAVDLQERVVYVNIILVCVIMDVIAFYAESGKLKRIRRTGIERNAMHIVGVHVIQPATVFDLIKAHPCSLTT